MNRAHAWMLSKLGHDSFDDEAAWMGGREREPEAVAASLHVDVPDTLLITGPGR